MNCSPQRYLANNTNALRTAALTPSSVEPIEDAVLSIPFARKGSAQVALTGVYTGAEEATYDIQIVDTTVATNTISAPVFSGAGSGTLSNIVASGTAQNYEVQLTDTGTPAAAAFVNFEGVKIVARASGTGGNSVRLLVDQSGLVFTPSSFSLLDDLPAGAGADANSDLTGAAFDWDDAVAGSDNQIPATAHRVSFGDDTSAIYVSYKRFDGTQWTYHFVPEIQRAVPKGTVVNFVTGGRDVTVTDGTSPSEDFADIVTVYDLLEALKVGSQLVDVAGVVSNDRSPTGQSARELSIRTDAHVDQTYGSGSAAATGFVDMTAAPGAGTELVTATLFAANSRDNPNASLGREMWHVKGSLSGALDLTAFTGIPYEGSPNWGFTIPVKLPDNYGAPTGRFDVESIDYQPRPEGVDPPPICVVALELGPEARDQTLTLRYTKRPSGACLCDKMPVPDLRTACLGIIGDGTGDGMGYSTDGQTRFTALYDWAATLAKAVSSYNHGFVRPTTPNLSETLAGGGAPASASVTLGDIAYSVSAPLAPDPGELTMTPTSLSAGFAEVWLPSNFQDCIDMYEGGIAAIDAVTNGTLKSAGFAQWDLALEAFQDDLDGTQLSSLGDRLASIAMAKYTILVKQAMVYAGVPQLGKTDADTVTTGDGCWRDIGDPFYWEIVGSDGGTYAWVFNNTPYYSSRKATDGGYYSTKEFAFQLNIKCPEGLLVDDEIVLTINGSGQAATYQIGDTLTMAIVSAQPFFLAGGQNVDPTQKWFVTGSVDGPLAPLTYLLTDTPPIAYDSGSPGSLAFDLNPGGIPFALGDKFTFGVEGAHYQWRKNGGAWSSPIAVPTSPAALDSGLSIAFTTGAEPSFVEDDTFKFRALQPWAVSNAQSPNLDRWQWNEDAPVLVCDCGEDVPIDAVCVALHTLPSTATVTVDFATAAAPSTWFGAVAPAWQVGAIVKLLAETVSARYVRFSFTGAIDAGAGWVYAGQPMATFKSADVQLTRSYKISRESVGLRNFGKYLGKTRGGTVAWSEGAILESDRVQIEDFLDWTKSNDDEAFVLVPQVTRPDEAFVMQVLSDDIDVVDVHDYNQDASIQRRFSATLPLTGFW